MNFPTKLARALTPVAIVAMAAPAAAAESADMAKLKAHISSVQSMTSSFVQTDAKGRSAAGTIRRATVGRQRGARLYRKA